MSIINTIYLHRMPETIDAVLTVQAYDPETPDIEPKKLFDRLPFRTGQYSLRHSDGWQHSAPIPKGDWWLWTDIENQAGQYHPHGREIGAFHYISSSKDNRLFIVNPQNVHQSRNAIGLHPENDYAGSLGCPVGIWDTMERERNLVKLIRWIESQKSVTQWIPFRVL